MRERRAGYRPIHVPIDADEAGELRSRLLATFESNHLEPTRGRQLKVAIALQDERKPANYKDTISFEVPPDFHTHNDGARRRAHDHGR